MSAAWAVILLVLVTVIALAVASFFQNTLAALGVLVAIPVGLILHALMGTGFALFAIGLLAVSVALIHTIGDTLRLLRTAKRRPTPARAKERTSMRRAA
jgi:hypothetical protein